MKASCGQLATVVASFGRQYEVLTDAGERLLCFPRAKKSDLACGDRVEVHASGTDQGVIESLQTRRNLLYRADHFKQKLIAANLDQVVIVVATQPAFNEQIITRCLCAAEAQEIDALIVLNKVDLVERLAAAQNQLAPFSTLGYPILPLCAKGDVSALRERLAGKTSLLVGQSGMGKSTLTNTLIPEAGAETREISEALDSGKHTTTHARRYPFADGGYIIDSPGLQTFGVAHLNRREIETGFRELDALHGQCRFRDCWHQEEPACAVRAAMQAGRMHPRRYAALCELLAEHRAKPAY